MLAVEVARQTILARTVTLPPTVEALMSSVLGLVLAEDVMSDLDSPPFAKAMMDGYAVCATDLQGDVELDVVETVAAGAMPMKSIRAGQATRIMTGAPIPEGADTVVKIEQSMPLQGNRVKLDVCSSKPGDHILRQGEEMRAGEVVLPRGTVLRPQEFGLLAAVGRTAVSLYPPPRVSVLCTGDELVEANTKPMGGQIRNSNGPMLVMQTVRAGGLPRYLGIARDRPDVMRSLIREGLSSDVLILSGGVSVGDFDIVPKILAEMGVETHFHKVAMKPGKPLLFGTQGNKLIFGLPGNPVSSFVGFELFVRPAIEALRGMSNLSPRQVSIPLANDFHHRSDRETYYPACRIGNTVQPARWFGSADLRGLTRADSLVVFPEGERSYAAGQPVPVIFLEQG